MHAAVGILTARGGMTSHAAVVARGWGKCCISGCSEIRVNEIEKVGDWEFSTLISYTLQLLQYKREYNTQVLFINNAGCCD